MCIISGELQLIYSIRDNLVIELVCRLPRVSNEDDDDPLVGIWQSFAKYSNQWD